MRIASTRSPYLGGKHRAEPVPPVTHPEALAQYKSLHAMVWPEVIAAIKPANMQNYTIFLKEPELLLFAYWEYVGTDLEVDMAAIAKDPAMPAWWAICDPLQHPFETRLEGEWWATMEQVFHFE